MADNKDLELAIKEKIDNIINKDLLGINLSVDINDIVLHENLLEINFKTKEGRMTFEFECGDLNNINFDELEKELNEKCDDYLNDLSWEDEINIKAADIAEALLNKLSKYGDFELSWINVVNYDEQNIEIQYEIEDSNSSELYEFSVFLDSSNVKSWDLININDILNENFSKLLKSNLKDKGRVK